MVIAPHEAGAPCQIICEAQQIVDDWVRRHSAMVAAVLDG